MTIISTTLDKLEESSSIHDESIIRDAQLIPYMPVLLYGMIELMFVIRRTILDGSQQLLVSYILYRGLLNGGHLQGTLRLVQMGNLDGPHVQ